jgi:hypothetical protein
VYTPAEREHLRTALVAAARNDERITGVALTGSAASDAEDEWSDIDLAFGVSDAELGGALNDWTDRMYQQHEALDHFDLSSGATIYRVFLLSNTLQVDLAFWPASEFGALNPASFRLLFGAAIERTAVPTPTAAHLIGFAWLHALHARSSIERGRRWQAEYMISGVRDQTLALACLRHGFPVAQGRGIDRLPASVTEPLEAGLVRTLEGEELRRAFRAATDGLLAEIRQSDAALAARLSGPLTELARSPRV